MGKTQSGAVWLDAEKTTPFEFYQYWRNVDDNDVIRCIKMLTFVPLDEIDELAKLEGSELNLVKKRLAYEVTKLVHGEEKAKEVQETAETLFSKGVSSENMPTTEIVLGSTSNILDIMLEAKLIPSRSEGRRLVQQGGVYINDSVISDVNLNIDETYFTNGEMIIRKGKKIYHKITLNP